MKCKLKSEILYNAQRADPRNTITDMRVSTLSADQVIANLNNVADSIGSENFEKELEERSLLAKALGRIPSFKEFGLIIPKRANYLYTSVSHFINNVIKNKEQSFDFINTLNLDGTISNTITNLITKKDGVYKTKYTSKELNHAIKTHLSNRLVSTERYYVSVKNGNVIARQVLADDINEYEYGKYLNTIGTLAEASVSHDVNVEEEYEEGTTFLQQAPIVSHLNQQIRAAESMKRKLKAGKTINPDRVIKLDEVIRNLKDRKEDISTALTEEELKSYIKNLLKDIKYNVSNNVHLSEEVVYTYITTLDLIKNAANFDITENRILEFAEIQDDDLMRELGKFQTEARGLIVDINNIAFDTVVKLAKERRIGEDFADSEFREVKNLGTAMSQMLIRIVGIQHIHNPIVQYIHKIIAQAAVKASAISRDTNDAIEKAYKAMQKSFGNNEMFIQRDEDGIPTGRMVDVFTAKYWKESRDFYTDWTERLNRAITLNPVLLFGKDLTAEEKVEAKELKKELLDNLGPYMYEQWIREAKRLWDMYESGVKLMKDSTHTKAEIDRWVMRNSPIHRMQNYQNEDKETRGSDKYLIVLPKKLDVDGENLGYYDSNYTTIMANEDAANFYKITRETFLKNQTDLENYSNKLKPPTLAYIGQSVIDNIRKKDYAGAAKLMRKNLAQEYSVKEKPTSKKYPVNSITGKYQAHLKYEVHDIPTEIRNRIRVRLATDVEYQTLLEVEGVEADQSRDAIEKKIKKEVASEVDSERSDDLLQSVVMANYATQTFLQKKLIETQVLLAQHVVNNDLIKTIPTKKGQEYPKKGQEIMKKAIEHYIDVAFYDKRNLTAPTPLGKIDPDNPDKKVFTSRGIIHGLMTFGRVVVLGWSAKLAMLNLGQQAFSNLMKAAEGTDFGFLDLMQGYKDIAKRGPEGKKNRSIVDRLFIAGDLAYTYDKRTIHEQSRFWANLHPMTFQSSAEKVNQGATSIAVLHFQKVTNSDTNEVVSLYDALDDNGDLHEKYRHAEYGDLSGLDLLSTLTVDKIRPVVMKTAGDYISPLLIEQEEWGKLITMFKKYLPEMLMDRFHAREYDYSLKRETEGRLYGLGAAAWQVMKERSFKGVKADRVRLAAAKAGLAEVTIALMLRAMFLGLAKLSCDTKECREQRPDILFGLNMLGRLADDVFSLTLPISLYNQILSPFAIQGVIKNFGTFYTNFTDYLVPGGDDGRYKRKGRGYEAGDLKFLNDMQRLIPFWRPNVYGIRQFGTKLSYDPTAYAFINDDDKIGKK